MVTNGRGNGTGNLKEFGRREAVGSPAFGPIVRFDLFTRKREGFQKRDSVIIYFVSSSASHCIVHQIRINKVHRYSLGISPIFFNPQNTPISGHLIPIAHVWSHISWKVRFPNRQFVAPNACQNNAHEISREPITVFDVHYRYEIKICLRAKLHLKTLIITVKHTLDSL